MKSIKFFTLAIVSLFFFASCSKNGSDIGVTVGTSPDGGIWIQIGSNQNNGGYYYQNGVPRGVTQFVGYVRGGSGDPVRIPVYYKNGTPMGFSASSTSLFGNMQYFFTWLSGQSSSTFVPVVIECTNISSVVDYKIIGAWW